MLRQLYVMGGHLGQEGFERWWRYLSGALGYFLIERLIRKPMWFYVVGHELTHAISGLMTGAEVHSFKASAKGGEVHLSKSNLFIALSPYVIPIYAVVVVSLYALSYMFWPIQKLTYIFQFLLGATLMFHLSHTISAIHGHQHDLKVVGFFLSGVLIAIGNSLILGVLGVTLFTRTPTIKQYSRSVASETMRIWMEGFEMTKREVVAWIH